jgi:TolA-binding protein
VFVLVVLFLWWYLNKETPTPSTEPQPSSSPVQEQSKPIDPNQPVAQTPAENPPGPADKVDGGKLFAANFRAYRSEDLQGMLRSEETPDAFQLFLSAYLRGEYARSLKLFENLPEEDRGNENILFLKANALLADNQTDAGVALLENLEKGNMFSYTAEARWYLALARLKKGETAEAKKLLEQLAKTPRGPYQSEAAQLLRKMQ